MRHGHNLANLHGIIVSDTNRGTTHYGLNEYAKHPSKESASSLNIVEHCAGQVKIIACIEEPQLLREYWPT